ncbi:hypothetical protein RJ639_015656 [Escallonia herrerae]|uniref:Uncharacterized protein n=1 Tax=Escallonia herrerae TaxID=1293975 RepID=A0AA89AIU5_9ASTE|nr:hypothetical protein RJ639_015656 [Escallonia herrerae]
MVLGGFAVQFAAANSLTQKRDLLVGLSVLLQLGLYTLMAPVRGYKKKRKVEKRVEHKAFLASGSSEDGSVDWWEDFSKRIPGMIPFLPGLAMMSRHLLVRPKVDIRREPDVFVTPNFVKTQSSNPVVNADPKLEFSVDHSLVTAQPKPVSHSVTTPPTTPNVFR